MIQKVSPKPTLILSTIVDTDRFKHLSYTKSSRDYLCYMGNMELAKDNVDNIIKAFNLIKDKFPRLDLYLFGAPSEFDKAFLLQLVQSLSLSDRSFF